MAPLAPSRWPWKKGWSFPKHRVSSVWRPSQALVLIGYKQEGSEVKSVKLTNIPAYLAAEGLTVECPELGELVIDVSYGGNFYAIVECTEEL